MKYLGVMLSSDAVISVRGWCASRVEVPVVFVVAPRLLGLRHRRRENIDSE